VAKKASPHAVIIRTLDLGGDKFISPLGISGELNPFLGWRGIRFCLERKDLFRVQLRAILRASAENNIKIMFPMISGFSEMQAARGILKKSMGELKREKIPFNPLIEVGAMVEIPSAALTADVLARGADFFSIGSNDLIQYTLAVDRVNEKIAHLYQPLHPAVLKLIHHTITAAHRRNIWVGMCGEMAGDILSVPILVGMGIDELSVSPMLVPEVKKVILSLNLAEARKLAEKVLGYSSPQRIENESRRLIKRVAPMLLYRENIRT
jgi:phosphotransferase system enzyme I (PtsI)